MAFELSPHALTRRVRVGKVEVFVIVHTLAFVSLFPLPNQSSVNGDPAFNAESETDVAESEKYVT